MLAKLGLLAQAVLHLSDECTACTTKLNIVALHVALHGFNEVGRLCSCKLDLDSEACNIQHICKCELQGPHSCVACSHRHVHSFNDTA